MRKFWVGMSKVGLFIWVVVAGCSGAPGVQNHPQPTLTIETEVFVDAGCGTAGGSRNCAPESPLGKLGCEAIWEPGDLLGGLQPSAPIAACVTMGSENQLEEGRYLYREGCRLPQYVRFVIWRDGDFQVVGSQADLIRFYAPIQGEEEALSYALAATGLGARYDLEPVKGYRYYVDELQDTHVTVAADGYHVLLYDYQVCGCGPHPTIAVEVLVTRDGFVEVLDRQAVFEDPAEDDLCID